MSRDIPQHLFQEIENFSRLKPEEETCGVIVDTLGDLSFMPCDNLSNNKKVHFLIDPKILIDNSVIFIYHSHVNHSSKPSVPDIRASNALGIPYLIYSLRDSDFYLYNCV